MVFVFKCQEIPGEQTKSKQICAVCKYDIWSNNTLKFILFVFDCQEIPGDD